MLQHTSSEVIIFRLQISLNLKDLTHCTDWELTKLIDIKRQEYANNRDKVSHALPTFSFKVGFGFANLK